MIKKYKEKLMKKNLFIVFTLIFVFICPVIMFGCSRDNYLSTEEKYKPVSIEKTSLNFTLLTPEEYSEELEEDYTEHEGVAYITNLNNIVNDLVIPAYITDGENNYRVIKILDYAFWNCTSLYSVTIPSTLIDIGFNAFYGCQNLYLVYFTGEVQNITINSSSFSECQSLKSVNVDSIVSWLNLNKSNNDKIIQAVYLYLKGEAIKDLIIPEGIINIAYHDFFNFKIITKVVISDSVTNIGEEAFYNCGNLNNIIIGNNLTNIGQSAFYFCNKLTNITIKSPEIYKKITSLTSAGYLIQSATTINVLASIVDDENNSNSFLNNASKYTKSDKILIDGKEYYSYIKI